MSESKWKWVKKVWPVVAVAWAVSPPSFKEKVYEVHQTVYDVAVEGIYTAITPRVSPVFLSDGPKATVWYPRYEFPPGETILPSTSSTFSTFSSISSLTSLTIGTDGSAV